MSQDFTIRIQGLAQFANLIEAKKFNNDEKETAKYSVNLWVTKEIADRVQEIANLKAEACKLPKSTYITGMNGEKIPVPGWKSPVRNGADNKYKPNDLPEYTHYIPLTTLKRPRLFDCRGSVRLLSLDEAENYSWSGAELVVDVFLYNKAGKNSVTAKINKVGYIKELVKFTESNDNPFDSVPGEAGENGFDAV
jgi:hypothetical protein